MHPDAELMPIPRIEIWSICVEQLQLQIFPCVRDLTGQYMRLPDLNDVVVVASQKLKQRKARQCGKGVLSGAELNDLFLTAVDLHVKTCWPCPCYLR